MDGPARFKQLQSDSSTSNIPVIFLTAKVLAAELDMYQDLGVAQFTLKPFNGMSLSAEISDRLGW